METVSGNVVSHSLAYLSLQKMVWGHPVLCQNLTETDQPFKNADFQFQSIFSHSASAVTPTEKLTRIGSLLRAFNESKTNSVRVGPKPSQRG